MAKGFKGRVAALATALAAALALAATPAFAATVPDQNIDTSVKGTLTIWKYDTNTLDNLDTNNDGYVSQQEMTAGVSSISDKALGDVTFKYLNVGGVIQYTKDNVTAIGYSLDSSVVTLLGLKDTDVAYTDTTVTPNVNYYSTATLDAALDTKTQTELEEFMATKSTTGSIKTETSGTNKGMATTGKNLAQGLYLVIESTYPADAVVTTAPFFVSVPMTDVVTSTDTEDNATTSYKWIYDVVCYPKNKVETPNINKVVVEDNNESKSIDGEIGQLKTFRIRADVPAHIGKLKTYYITDNLGKALTMDSSENAKIAVYGVKSDGSRTELTTAADGYPTITNATNADGETVYTFTFTPSKLAYSDTTKVEKDTSGNVTGNTGDKNTALYTYIEIEYEAALNENAVVGGTGNSNKAQLVYSTKTNTGEETEKDLTKTDETTATVYTYAVDLLKYLDGNTSAPGKGVTFELYRENSDTTKSGFENAEKLSVLQATSGFYYPSTASTATTTLKTGNDGKLNIHGLEKGTYYLLETSTIAGYNLLKDPIKLEIVSNETDEARYVVDDNDHKGTFVKVEEGVSYYADAACTTKFNLPANSTGKFVDFGIEKVYTAKNTVATMYYQKDLTWYCKGYTMGDADNVAVDTAGNTLTGQSATTGTIILKVNNTKGFSLPLTGEQALPLMLLGGLLIAGGAFFIAGQRTRRRSETR